MDCIECKATNPDGNRFCGQCGAELGRTLDETVRKKGFRDRQATEMEIAESVVVRLMKWATWLGSITAVIVALFGLMLGWSYHDVRTAVESGKTQIDAAVREGTKDIDVVTQATTGLNIEVKQLQFDVDRYKQVNSMIAKVQKELTEVKKDVVDLGNRTLKVGSLETTGTGASYLGFGKLGCSSSELAKGYKGYKVGYCAQGSPPVLFQLNSTGELRPVSSLSPVGFQDVSVATKPACTAANRGTFYVEKGTANMADKPFLCAKKSDNTYDWIQLGMAP